MFDSIVFGFLEPLPEMSAGFNVGQFIDQLDFIIFFDVRVDPLFVPMVVNDHVDTVVEASINEGKHSVIFENVKDSNLFFLHIWEISLQFLSMIWCCICHLFPWNLNEISELFGIENATICFEMHNLVAFLKIRLVPNHKLLLTIQLFY